MNKEMIGFDFSLDGGSGLPLYRQIGQRFKEAIINRSYPPGTRVPSIRTLATVLKLSRNTVEMAYDLLIGEGFFTTKGQAGTFVSRECAYLLDTETSAPPPQTRPAQPDMLPFQIGLPALDAFPLKIWSALSKRQLCSYRDMTMNLAPVHGYEPLRKITAAYLRISRGVKCDPSQVFITTGYRQSMQLVLSCLLKPGDAVWTEDPCYPPTRALLEQFDLKQVHVPVDAEGMVVGEGIKKAAHARLALVTPQNQNPLGMVLSQRRKFELLAWADRERAWIVEDDYDSEYCCEARLAPTISNLDQNGRTLYLGTFSKTLHPALRLAYVVVPEQMTEQFNRHAETIMDGCPLYAQRVLADFMIEGHFARHLKKMRGLYARRRQALVDALRAQFGNSLRVSELSRSLCLLAYLKNGERDVDVARRASASGLAVGALSSRTREYDYGQALLLGYANFVDDASVRAAVETLARCMSATGAGAVAAADEVPWK